MITSRTACPAVLFTFTKRPGRNRSGYVAPLKNAFDADPRTMGLEMKAVMFQPRRDLSNPEEDRAMLAQPDKNWLWWGLTQISADTDQTPTNLGNHHAKYFTNFAKTSPAYSGENKFEFLRDETTEPPSPVNHYVRNADAVIILKKVYSNPTTTKQDIEDSVQVMEQFFGSQEEGIRVLADYTENDWANLD